MIGSNPQTRGQKPGAKSDWQRWGMNNIKFSDPDLWFELHKNINVNFLRNNIDCPIMVRSNSNAELLKNAAKYPFWQMIPKYGYVFASTVDYMIALAIEKGAEEIGIWGIQMTCSETYRAMRPYTSYWMGLAKTKGIKVYMADKEGPQPDMTLTKPEPNVYCRQELLQPRTLLSGIPDLYLE